MSIEIDTSHTTCYRCGTRYAKESVGFYQSFGSSHKGVRRLHICKKCVDAIYLRYLDETLDPKKSMRQLCRKLDIYWDEGVYESAEKKSTPKDLYQEYIKAVNRPTYQGKDYDDTLIELDEMWDFDAEVEEFVETAENDIDDDYIYDNDDIEVTPEIVSFWGAGHKKDMYQALEQRRQHYMSRLEDPDNIDIGTEVLIKQLCNIDVDINRAMAGGSDVTKLVNSMNSIIGSLNLKPEQQSKKERERNQDETPFGVWIRRWEQDEPIPEVLPELEDVDNVKRYIHIWFFGHLAKMLGVRNKYSRLYDEEIDRLRIERPEFADDEDDLLIEDVLGDASESDNEEV